MKKELQLLILLKKLLKATQNEFKSNPNKVWVDKGSEFYRRSKKLWLEENNMEMYSMHNKWKSVVADRFIKVL